MHLQRRDQNGLQGRTYHHHHTGTGDKEECQACGVAVAWYLVEDPFFGFQNCSRAKEAPHA